MLNFSQDDNQPQNSNQASSPLYIHENHAFLKLPEVKLDLIDCLYVEATPEHLAPNYDYTCEVYKTQFKALMNLYKTLSLSEMRISDIERLKKFQDEFLFENQFSKFEHYRETDNAEYFGSIKKLLEENYIYLLNFQQTQHEKFTAELSQTITAIKSCAPGVFTHLQDINSRLKSQDHIISWMADLRMSLVKFEADKHAIKHNIEPIYHAHVRQAFINLTNNLGFNLPKDNNDDPFEKDAHLSETEILAFLDKFHHAYQAKDLLECVALHFQCMLNKFNEKFHADSNGWIALDDQYSLIQKEGYLILNALSLSPNKDPDLSLLFDYSADYSQIKIRESFIKDLKKYIKDKLLEQKILTSEKKYAYHLEHQAIQVELSSRWDHFSLAPPSQPHSRRHLRDGFVALFFGALLLSSVALMLTSVYFFGLTAALSSNWLYHAILITSTMSSALFVKACLVIHDKILNRCTQSYRQLSDLEFNNLSQNERLAFKDGLEAQVSYKAQAATLFAWRDYRHMSAYYAGMNARITNDEDLIEKMRPTAQP